MWPQVLRGYKERLCRRRWGEMRKVTLTVKGHLGGPETVKDTWGGPSDAANEGHLGGLDTSVEGHLGGLETVEGHFRRALLQMKDTWAGPTHQHIFWGNAGIPGPRSCSLGNCIQYSGCIQAERVPTSSSAVDLSLLTGWFVLSARQVTRKEVL